MNTKSQHENNEIYDRAEYDRLTSQIFEAFEQLKESLSSSERWQVHRARCYALGWTGYRKYRDVEAVWRKVRRRYPVTSWKGRRLIRLSIERELVFLNLSEHPTTQPPRRPSHSTSQPAASPAPASGSIPEKQAVPETAVLDAGASTKQVFPHSPGCQIQVSAGVKSTRGVKIQGTSEDG